MKGHLIFHCPMYYEINRRSHCLYKESNISLTIFFQYLNHRCLALFLRKVGRHETKFMGSTEDKPYQAYHFFFSSILMVDDHKQHVDSQEISNCRSMRPCTYSHLQLEELSQRSSHVDSTHITVQLSTPPPFGAHRVPSPGSFLRP
jgi:hypothetical protein